MKTNLRQVFSLLMFFAVFSMAAQNNYWEKISVSTLKNEKTIERAVTPTKFEVFKLNLNAFKNALIGAPLRGSISGKSTKIVEFPTPEGKLEKFRVAESPIMEPGLAVKFPGIKTYKATGIDDPTATMRFSVTQFGVHAMSLSGQRSTTYIDPYTEDRTSYMIFSRKDIGANPQDFECLTEQGIDLNSIEEEVSTNRNDTDDSVLRTYRLAQSNNAPYGNIFANPGTEVEDIQAQMAITINRVNEIYERDLAITLVFVANNDQLIYWGDSADDPWNGEYNNTTQQVIDSTIGSANYDIGHNFNTTGGGNAGCIACVCIDGSKGSAYTGSSNPVGDPFYIDYVAHEMGHQFGGFHTMNTCSRSGDGTTEVEPASGSSIMGYAGICSTNVQSNSDAHFNYVNVRDISENIQPGGNSTCGAQTTLNNQPPVADAGADYTIPISTAYVLRGSATDPDGMETLTYNWAPNDPDEAPSSGSPQSTWTVGPLYRSIMPTQTPDRYMPKLSDVLAGNLTPTWEVTPSVSRVMNFSFIVRDNGSGFAAGIGQTDADLMQVIVDDSAGPFVVTSQNTGTTWTAGETQTITWDVANTDVAPINAANVNILLSNNGGLSFDTVLASNVPNNGSYDITVPAVQSTQEARVMVEAADNIFYAVNAEEFAIETAEFEINFTEDEVATCQPNDAEYNFTYNTLNGFNEETTFSVSGLPAGTTASFSPATATNDATSVDLTITDIANASVGEYILTVTGTSASITRTEDIVLHVYSDNISPVVLTTPNDGEIDLDLVPLFAWEADENAENYQIQVAEDVDFNSIVLEEITDSNSYTSSVTFEEETTYYWRVRAINTCGNGPYSSIRSFTIGECSLCNSVANTSYQTSVTKVVLNTIDNSSGKPSGYSDYTNISTTLVQEESYDLTVNVNTDGDYPAAAKVWIDWNQDCNFDGPNEEYDLGSATNTADGPTAASPLNITVPANAVLGNTTMRVSVQYNEPATACANGFDGEVEDYTINVTDELSVEANSLDAFSIYPNPNNGQFTLGLASGTQEKVQVSVFDLSGRLVYEKEFEPSNSFEKQINLGNVQSGVYLMNISSGNSNTTKKLIVE